MTWTDMRWHDWECPIVSVWLGSKWVDMPREESWPWLVFRPVTDPSGIYATWNPAALAVAYNPNPSL